LRISLICCPFKTSYGWYGNSLKTAIEKRSGDVVQWVASNCGCGDPVSDARQFLLDKQHYAYFETITPGYIEGQRFRDAARTLLLYLKARRYAALSGKAEVVHFQQTLNGYGAKAVFHWLNQPSIATRVVTVHELDPEQLKFPERNTAYNRADAIIVHCEEMKGRLVVLKVPKDKIHVVLHGTYLPTPLTDNSREGIVFYGAHHLNASKGIEPLFKAMSIVKQRMGATAPKLKIHGYYGMSEKEQAIRVAENFGVANDIVWLDLVPPENLGRLYQHSQVCVLPYSGSFAGLPASLAAACELPVVATRKAGLPDHLADTGIWIEENEPEQLASKTIELLSNSRLAREIGVRLRKRAEEFLSWERIADRTLEVYEKSTRKKVNAVRTLSGARQEAPDIAASQAHD
jgi:glycosyltransferase involved in cell wall biosynthesis